MPGIDFTNYENTMRRVIWGYIYTAKIKIHNKDISWDVIISEVIMKCFAIFA